MEGRGGLCLRVPGRGRVEVQFHGGVRCGQMKRGGRLVSKEDQADSIHAVLYCNQEGKQSEAM
jgi:hypothetical protein